MPCTGAAEIIAYYDGTAPAFSLNDETNPNGGINLTYQGALPYINTDGTDRCPALDPSTGYQVQRSVNVYISCNKSAPGLTVVKYTERGQCQYFIEAQSALACGVPVGTPTPGPPAPPGAAAQPATALVVGTAFGGAFAGALAVIAALLFFRGGGAAHESKQSLLRGSSGKLAMTYGAVEAGGGAGAAGWGTGMPQQAAGEAPGGGQGYCTSCGAQRGPGARFCGGCGQQFA